MQPARLVRILTFEDASCCRYRMCARTMDMVHDAYKEVWS